MFYLSGVKDADIGGHGFSRQYPFILRMNPGRDDYIVLLIGAAEKADILEKSKDLLGQLCSYGITFRPGPKLGLAPRWNSLIC